LYGPSAKDARLAHLLNCIPLDVCEGEVKTRHVRYCSIFEKVADEVEDVLPYFTVALQSSTDSNVTLMIVKPALGKRIHRTFAF